MKIAITGGSGFIGKEVCDLAKKSGHIPIVLGRNNFSKLSDQIYRTTDYSSESLMEILHDIDAVIHLAAVRGSNATISEFIQNEIITECLYEICARLGIKNVVYASSISVYSDVEKIPWSEDQVAIPKTKYGISKLACEYLGAIYHKNFGLNIKSLRIAHVLGEEERKGYMMNTFIDNAYDKKTLSVIGKSIAKREFVYVKDVARAILIAVSRPDLHGVFNVGSGEAYTNLEIAHMVNKIFENEGNLIYNDKVDEGIESSLMDGSKADNILGYRPEFTFEMALKDIKKSKKDKR